MSHLSAAFDRAAGGFPRVSGDEPVVDQAALGGASFSPRERG